MEEGEDKPRTSEAISAGGDCPYDHNRTGCADAATSGERGKEHGGERPAVAMNGQALCGGSQRDARASSDSGGDGETKGRSKATDTVPAETVIEEGLVYLNTATGETAREPPAELVARVEEAESAGEYLVFVPSRSFMAAVARNATVATDTNGTAAGTACAAVGVSSSLSEAASTIGAAAERALQGVVSEPCSSVREEAAAKAGGDSSARKTATSESCGRQEGRIAYQSPLEAPTPPTAVKREGSTSGGSRGSGSRANGSGGGGETWDRLSSLPMIDLSQGVASAPLDVDQIDVGGGNVGGGTGKVESEGCEEGAGITDGGGKVAATMWACCVCTLLNKARRTTCAACSNRRPANFGRQQVMVQRGRDEGAWGVSGRAGNGKLRLMQRRGGGSTPQSSITSFTGPTRDNGKGKGSGRGSNVASSGTTATAGSCSRSSSQSSQPPAAASPTAVLTPTNGTNGVPTQPSSPPAPAAATAAATATADTTRQ